ncbi:FG-GAP-like repeat-containing protein [Streptomyces sp. NPDC051976]|uniref:FG-GAP-like repeat-containing protein n=1 Tax=Streptomyces sp. NPDC051976 TaxID=3154947 RepID=UPI00343977EF
MATLSDTVTGVARSTVTLPARQYWTGAFNDQYVVTFAGMAPGESSPLHLLSEVDGATVDRPVTGDGSISGNPETIGQQGQDANGALLCAGPGTGRTAYLDYATATVKAIPGSDCSTDVLSADYIAIRKTATTVQLVPRHDLGAAPITVTIPLLTTRGSVAVAGDWIIYTGSGTTDTDPASEGAAVAVPIHGGSPSRNLLAHAYGLFTAPDGTALVSGGTDATHWGIWRVGVGADGVPTATESYKIPPTPGHVTALTLSGGRLTYVQNKQAYQQDVSFRGTPKATDPSKLAEYYSDCDSYMTSGCGALQGMGNDKPAYTHDGTGGDGAPYTRIYVPSSGAQRDLQSGASIRDASDRYVVADDPGGHQQLVLSADSGLPQLLKRSITAAAVWGSTFWALGAAPGTLTATDLTTLKTTESVTTGTSCTPDDLQAAGRWVYWSCGTTAGVYDRNARRSIAVPTGDALPGDGYLVRQDTAAGKLLLTDFHSGTAATSDFADVPTGASAPQRGITWSVDKYGGDVAYLDADQRIHVKQVAVPRSPMTLLSRGGENGWLDLSPWLSPEHRTWQGRWQLSRPSRTWSVTITNGTGAVVASLRGTAHGGARAEATWDGSTSGGKQAPNGVSYRVSFTAQPGDGQGAAVVTSEHLSVSGYAWARDYNGEWFGDLLAVTPSGRLDMRTGSSSNGGTLGSGPTGSGWPTSSTIVPFGDLDEDRYNDILVRDSGGKLWRYSGQPGKPFTPSSPHMLIGGGWNIYNTLISAGDFNGDFHPDLVARDTAGNLYLYESSGAGAFAPRVKIGYGYGIYTLMTGINTPNGVGRLLARDASGVLWRYDGVGNGTGALRPRVRIGGGWNVYNSVVGVGDLNGDGRPELLARDAAGGLWRYDGTRDYLFAPRVSLGGGWQTYKALL